MHHPPTGKKERISFTMGDVRTRSSHKHPLSFATYCICCIRAMLSVQEHAGHCWSLIGINFTQALKMVQRNNYRMRKRHENSTLLHSLEPEKQNQCSVSNIWSLLVCLPTGLQLHACCPSPDKQQRFYIMHSVSVLSPSEASQRYRTSRKVIWIHIS